MAETSVESFEQFILLLVFTLTSFMLQKTPGFFLVKDIDGIIVFLRFSLLATYVYIYKHHSGHGLQECRSSIGLSGQSCTVPGC